MRARPEEDLYFNLALRTFHSADQLVLRHEMATLVGLGCDRHQVSESSGAARSDEGCRENVGGSHIFALHICMLGGSDRPSSAAVVIQDGSKDGGTIEARPAEPVH